MELVFSVFSSTCFYPGNIISLKLSYVASVYKPKFPTTKEYRGAKFKCNVQGSTTLDSSPLSSYYEIEDIIFISLFCYEFWIVYCIFTNLSFITYFSIPNCTVYLFIVNLSHNILIDSLMW